MGLKGVALSGLRVVNPSFEPNAIEEQNFKDKFFPDVKQPVFDERFI